MARTLQLLWWMVALFTVACPAAAAHPGAEAFRHQPPQPAPPRHVKTPVPQRFALANGTQVVLIERHELPLVSIQLVLPGGAAQDPADRAGMASACMALLGQGTASLDKVQLATRLADLGATLESWATVDRQGLQLAVLSRNLSPALDLFADSLLRPGLRQDELARQVARRKAALEQAKASPSALAGRLAASVGYGPAHPRGRVATAASLGRITVADCRAHVAQLSPQGAWLYVVGDLDRAAVERELGGRLAAWTTAAAAGSAALPSPQPRRGRLFVVAVPGASQSVVTLMHSGPRRDAPDHEATALLMGILSSGFSSRINMNLRERHGWAYGAGGGLDYTREGSLLAIQAAVRADATGPAVSELFGEITAITAAVVRPDELEREQQGAILAQPARWATGRSIAQTLESLRYFGLPFDWLDGFAERTLAVDAAAVLAAAQRHLRPSAAQVLVVGDLAKISGQLQQLTNTGPLAGETIVLLDGDGEVVTAGAPPKPSR